MPDNQTITLSKIELARMLDDAASNGARRALKEIGLSYPEAARDIYALRDLINSYRVVKSTVTKTIVQWLTVAIIGSVVTAVYFYRG